jgi:hypothetical protein
MTALNWIRSKAKTTVEVCELGGKMFEVTRVYFRGSLSFQMANQVKAEARKGLENTETTYENILFSNKTNCEYWHTTYTEVVA